MPSYHIPERLETDALLRTRASFYPDNIRHSQNTSRSSEDILNTFGFRNVGQIVADNQLNGMSAQQVNVINYTDDYLVLLDKWNRVQVIPPVPEYEVSRKAFDGAIFIEIVNSKAFQSPEVGARVHRRYRNVQLLHKGEVGGYYYKEATAAEAPKHLGNQIHQFSITDASNVLNELGGSFYCPNTDLVFMTMTTAETGELVLHPNTDATVLAELGLDEEIGKVITHQISVNKHRSHSSWINIGGDVVNVPNTNDPTMPEGISIRRQECRRGSKSRIIYQGHFSFNDPSCPIHVFDSENAAITQGNPDKAVELEIARTKLLTEQAKSENARENQDFLQQKIENDKSLEKERVITETHAQKKQRETLEANTLIKLAQAQAEKDKADQARKEFRSAHLSRMLEISGKIALAVAGIITAGLSIYKLKKS